MNAQDLYRSGDLTGAIANLNDTVRSKPTEVTTRSFLAELLCVAGNLERADSQLETIEKIDSKVGPALGLIRQLVRAEKSRQEVFTAGRAPEFLGNPPAHVEGRLRALVAFRAGDLGATGQELGAAEEARPSVAGTCDGNRFDDFRDLDDLFGGFLEVLTSTGKYMWVPTERVVSVEFDAPEQPLDLLWRPARMEVRDGPEGKVFLPTIYPGGGDAADDASRLGRRTDWIEVGAGDAVRGVGLRTFIVGDEARTILEIEKLEFDQVGA
ncbi:MAG: type VI secretion system accessory protein TagJ [Planctomycetota bacterium]